MDNHSKILVIGATGNVGRNVVPQLTDLGASVRAISRNPRTAALPDGVEVVPGDLTEPDTVAAALDGVDRIFLLWPSFTADGVPAIADVLASQVRHVVYLSAMNVRDDQDLQANGVWGAVEHAIEQTGLEWTFLRAGGFATNTLEWVDQVRSGVVRGPFGRAARSLIHERDIADVAVRALTEPGHAGAKYVLTGPEAVSMADQVRIIGDAIGRSVRWEQQSPDEARQEVLARWGDVYADSAFAYWASLVDDPEPVTTTVEEITGRPARTFRQWAADHADDFRTPSAEKIAAVDEH